MLPVEHISEEEVREALILALDTDDPEQLLDPPEPPKPVVRPPPDWAGTDRYDDPRFRGLNPDWRHPIDWRLQPDSPAINAGVVLPADWPDPFRTRDTDKPDIGAVPLGTDTWRVGVRGRVTLVP